MLKVHAHSSKVPECRAAALKGRSHPSILLGIIHSHVYLGILPLYKVLIPEVDFSSPTAEAAHASSLIEFIVNGFLISPVEAKP